MKITLNVVLLSEKFLEWIAGKKMKLKCDMLNNKIVEIVKDIYGHTIILTQSVVYRVLKIIKETKKSFARAITEDKKFKNWMENYILFNTVDDNPVTMDQEEEISDNINGKKKKTNIQFMHISWAWELDTHSDRLTKKRRTNIRLNI